MPQACIYLGILLLVVIIWFALFKRPVYKPLLECGLFRICVVMNEDKSWILERIK